MIYEGKNNVHNKYIIINIIIKYKTDILNL